MKKYDVVFKVADPKKDRVKRCRFDELDTTPHDQVVAKIQKLAPGQEIATVNGVPWEEFRKEAPHG